MAEATKIQWTHHTFNPWIGCSKVSEACKHCYAETLTKARPALVLGPQKGQGGSRAHLQVWGEQAPRRVTSAANWREPLRWDRAAAKAGERRLVFCASLADVFEDYGGIVAGDFARFTKGTGQVVPTMADLHDVRAHLWRLIEETRNLTWLLLTKRPENVLRMVKSARGWLGAHGWPRHVWLGFTGETQERFDERWAHAKKVPAPVIFASVEPQLGPVVLPADFLARGQGAWCITGGESGSGARPFDLAWARSAVAQCKSAGVPVFVKQMGARPMWDGRGEAPPLIYPDFDDEAAADWGVKLRDRKGGAIEEWPADLQVRQWPEVTHVG